MAAPFNNTLLSQAVLKVERNLRKDIWVGWVERFVGPVHLHEFCRFGNSPCDIFLVTFVSVELALGLEVENVVESSIGRVEHVWQVIQCDVGWFGLLG